MGIMRDTFDKIAAQFEKDNADIADQEAMIDRLEDAGTLDASEAKEARGRLVVHVESRLEAWYREHGVFMNPQRVVVSMRIDPTVSEEAIKISRRKRFTDDEVRRIRAYYHGGGRRPRKHRVSYLAKQYACTPEAIRQMVKGITYKHVTA